MTKRAVLVVGPESSGNRLITRLLVAAGCEGDGDHVQRWDYRLPECESPIVWLRSVPHNGAMPDLNAMCCALEARGYEPMFVIMTRDWHSLIESQVRWGHAQNRGKAAGQTRRAYSWIFAHASDLPFVVVSYEALIARPLETMTWLCEALGFPFGLESLPEEIRDENAKYYAETQIISAPAPPPDSFSPSVLF